MVKSLGVLGGVIELDNQVAIKLSGSDRVGSSLGGVVSCDGYQTIKAGFWVSCLAWVKREANGLAPVVATKALNIKQQQ